MPLQIIRNDITKLTCDAIVNAANSTLLGGGGVDGAIHRAAGRELLMECKGLGGCETGQAKITGGYNLPCKHVIHTVGPIWRGGNQGEKELLESCYRSSLTLAKEYECESVAFPLISSGIYGYPKAEALKVAVDVISSFLLENDMLVYIVIFDKASYQIGEKLFSDIKSFIDDNYVDLHTEPRFARMRAQQSSQIIPELNIAPPKTVKSDRAHAISNKLVDDDGFDGVDECAELYETAIHPMPTPMATAMPLSLENALNQIDESFSEMLLRKIDEKGMTDSQCYKKANVDRKLFSKIRSDNSYHPSKATAIAFAIALELSLEETKDMLMKAGFALSHSNKFDIIIEYFITKGNYNIFEINEALFAFDQNLLG